MVSHIVQYDDCNALAMYQVLITRIFAEHIGIFMDMDLDDTIIYLNTHVKHVTIVIQILRKEELYLSEKKLHFLHKEVKILGSIVTDDGIRMDPKSQLEGPDEPHLMQRVHRSSEDLADDIYKVHALLGVLTEASAESKPFQRSYTSNVRSRQSRDMSRCVRPTAVFLLTTVRSVTPAGS